MSEPLSCSLVRKFIREGDIGAYQTPVQPAQPRPTGTRTEVHDFTAPASFQGFDKIAPDRAISIQRFDRDLKEIGQAVPNDLGAPGVIVQLRYIESAHLQN